MMQTSCRISSGSEHSITSYAPQSQLFVDCFKFACKVSLLCGPTKSVILHYHLNLKIDSELHGHNRLRIKPFRVFSMEELGRLGTAWREKAIMVGRDSFFDLSTAYLGVQRHSCVMSYSIPLISSKMPRHKQFRLQIFTKKKLCKHHLICTWQDTCRHQQSRCRRLGASQWGRGWDAEMEWSQWAGGWGHPLQPEFFTQSNTHNLSTLPVT